MKKVSIHYDLKQRKKFNKFDIYKTFINAIQLITKLNDKDKIQFLNQHNF